MTITNAISDSSMTMRTVNKFILVGLLLTGTVFFISFGLGIQGGFISLASYFLGYVLVIYSIVSFLWVGLLYLVQRRKGFLRTLYPLNGLIAVVGCLIVLLV